MSQSLSRHGIYFTHNLSHFDSSELVTCADGIARVSAFGVPKFPSGCRCRMSGSVFYGPHPLRQVYPHGAAELTSTHLWMLGFEVEGCWTNSGANTELPFHQSPNVRSVQRFPSSRRDFSRAQTELQSRTEINTDRIHRRALPTRRLHLTSDGRRDEMGRFWKTLARKNKIKARLLPPFSSVKQR